MRVCVTCRLEAGHRIVCNADLGSVEKNDTVRFLLDLPPVNQNLSTFDLVNAFPPSLTEHWGGCKNILRVMYPWWSCTRLERRRTASVPINSAHRPVGHSPTYRLGSVEYAIRFHWIFPLALTKLIMWWRSNHKPVVVAGRVVVTKQPAASAPR